MSQENTQNAPSQEKTPKTRCVATFQDLPHHDPMWVDLEFFEECGLADEVKKILKKSGWPGLIYLCGGAVKEDVCAFLGTLKDFHGEDPPHFTYIFRDRRFSCTYEKLSSIFGWPKKGTYRDGGLGTETQLWDSLTGRHIAYYPSFSKTRSIKKPSLFYLKHALSRTIFAKESGKDKVKRLELGLLSLLNEGKKVDWGAYFIEHLKNLSLDGPVEIGGMVTLFLQGMHPEEERWADRTFSGQRVLGLAEFKAGKNIRVTSAGELQWIYFEDKTLKPPRSPKSKGGRPKRVREQGETSLALTQQQGAGSEPHQQHGVGQWSQQQLDAMFYSARCQIWGAAHLPFVSAPPGWTPGDAVPPEYLFPPGGTRGVSHLSYYHMILFYFQ